MNINDVLTEAKASHDKFSQTFGQPLQFYVRAAGVMSTMTGREVTPKEIALFELAHAQARIALNGDNQTAYTDMILATAASKLLAPVKTSNYSDAMLADVETSLQESMRG